MALADEFLHELRRINRFLKAAEKRGFQFSSEAIPEIPSRITKKSVEKIKAIGPNELYQLSVYTVPETGDIIPGEEGRKYERSQAAKRGINKSRPKAPSATKETAPKQTDVILNNVAEELERWDTNYDTYNYVKNSLDNWQPNTVWSTYFIGVKEHDRNILMGTFMGAVSSEGAEAVARRMQEHAEQIKALVDNVLYGSGGGGKNYDKGRESVERDIVTFSTIIMGRALTVNESKRITDVAENLEVNN